MVNLLAIWRAHGLDSILRLAWKRGVVLAGQSAGAMCWFECGVTRSAGETRLAAGLGLIPGILSVHYHRDPDRRRVLRDAVGRRGQAGFGIDDGAGLVLRGRRAAQAISGHETATVWRVDPDGSGGGLENDLEAESLPAPRAAIDEVDADVIELRRVLALRAGRR